MGEVAYWSNETVPTMYAAVQTLNLAERAAPSPELVRAYASMGLSAGFASLHWLALCTAGRLTAAAQKLHNQPAQIWVLEITGVYALGAGRWAQAEEALRQAVITSDQLQDRRRWQECQAALNEVAYFQARFNDSLAGWPALYASASRRDDDQARSWGLAGQLRCLLALGQAGSAQAARR